MRIVYGAPPEVSSRDDDDDNHDKGTDDDGNDKGNDKGQQARFGDDEGGAIGRVEPE